MTSQINVQVLNHVGTGFAETRAVFQGTTLLQLFQLALPGKEPNAFAIKVNGSASHAGYVLREGDVVSFTPDKIKGA